MKFNLLLSFCLFISSVLKAQQLDVDIRKLTIEEGFGYAVSAMEMLPDNNTIAIGTAQGPLYIWDLAGEKLIKRIEVSGYRLSGPRITVSKDGKLLLLEQQYYNDLNLNTDKTGQVEVLDIESGKVLLKVNDVHDAELSPDNKYLLTLSASKVNIYNIQSGKHERSIVVEDATNAVSISPDGQTIVVAHKLRKEDLQHIPSVRGDKKAQKSALKYRQTISLFSFIDGTKQKTINELFDIVYSIRFSKDGSKFFVYNVANTKLQAQAGGSSGNRQGYINQVDVSSAQVLRTMFSSMAPEPDYKENPENTLLGVSSADIDRKLVPSLLLYETELGSIVKKYEMNVRLLQEKSIISPIYFVFYPSGDKVLFSYGSKLGVWNIK